MMYTKPAATSISLQRYAIRLAEATGSTRASPGREHPAGKLVGVPCPHLTRDRRCAIFGRPGRPLVCQGLQASRDMCGDSPDDALATLARWERLTAP